MRFVQHADRPSKDYHATAGISDHALAVGTYVILAFYAVMILIAVFGTVAHY